MDLLYFILCSYGLTQILIYGSIFDSFRPKDGKLGELFRCPMCMGFWAGSFLFNLPPSTSPERSGVAVGVTVAVGVGVKGGETSAQPLWNPTDITVGRPTGKLFNNWMDPGCILTSKFAPHHMKHFHVNLKNIWAFWKKLQGTLLS